MVVPDASLLFNGVHSEDLSASIHLNSSYSSANEFSHAGEMIFRESVSCSGDISSSRKTSVCDLVLLDSAISDAHRGKCG